MIVWGRPNPSPGALGDKFRPATSYITVACRGARRYFDLDAVRVEHKPHTAAYGDRRKLSPNNGYDVPTRGDGGAFTGDLNQAGAPPLDWHADDHPEDGDWLWKLSTQPYAGSHYATFPMALPSRLIDAMCPQRVCEVCGKPSERIVDVDYEAHGIKNPDERRLLLADALTNPSAQGMKHGRATRVVTGTAWTDCGHDAWRNGRVLDPFGGSGTTGAAASGLGRDSILIDLDDRNVDLARERCGMFLEVVGD